MKHEFKAIVTEFNSKNSPVYFVSPSHVIFEASSLQDDDEFVKFVVPIEDIVEWNSKKIRVTIETE